MAISAGSEPEKMLSRASRSGGDFLQRRTAQFGDFFGNKQSVRRLAAFASVGHGGKVGAIGLNHKRIRGNGGNDVANESGIFEGDYTGERNEMAEGKDFLRLIGCVSKAMEHSAKTSSEIF